jgi:hypothetical protein
MFVGFSSIFLLGILIFKGLIARRLYKSFDIKGLTYTDKTKLLKDRMRVLMLKPVQAAIKEGAYLPL